MRTTLTTLFCGMLALTACRAPSSRAAHHAEFVREYSSTGLMLGTIKALDSGDTDKAYHLNLLLLKEQLTHTEELSLSAGAIEEHRQMLRLLSQVILAHLEKFKERPAQNTGTDHLALEITNVLARTLNDKHDRQRAEALQKFFASRFVEERNAIKKFNE